MRAIVIVLLAFCFLTACNRASNGPDLVGCNCQCEVEGGFVNNDPVTGQTTSGFVPVQALGLICVDKSDAQAVHDSCEDQCACKSSDLKSGFCFCINCAKTVQGCRAVPVSAGGPVGVPVAPYKCPDGSLSRLAGGDFGLAHGVSIDPTTVALSGGDINGFTVTPNLAITTTQSGSTLTVEEIIGTIPDTDFTSSGIFSDDDHTFRGGQMFLRRAFAVDLQSDGSFVIPAGDAILLLTGFLDGDQVAVDATNSHDISGHYSEEQGVFDMAGHLSASDADIDLDVTMTFEFDNRPPQAVAGPHQVVECESTLQQASVHFSGDASTDPDGAADLARFGWLIDAATTPLAVEGEDIDVTLPLGQHTAQLTVLDRSSSFGRDTTEAEIRDSRGPAIAITQPGATGYPHSATLVLDYAVTDACTGVASFKPTLDGSPTLSGHGLADGQAIDLLTQLALGSHAFEIDALDNVGNPSTTTVTFTIIVTAASIKEDVNQFLAMKAIRNGGQANSLLAKLDAAAQARARGNCNAAGNNYSAFVNELQAQSGKGVNATAAAIMIADAQYLIAHCP
jgi:FIMAH domain-containing protein